MLGCPASDGGPPIFGCWLFGSGGWVIACLLPQDAGVAIAAAYPTNNAMFELEQSAS